MVSDQGPRPHTSGLSPHVQGSSQQSNETFRLNPQNYPHLLHLIRHRTDGQSGASVPPIGSAEAHAPSASSSETPTAGARGAPPSESAGEHALPAGSTGGPAESPVAHFTSVRIKQEPLEKNLPTHRRELLAGEKRPEEESNQSECASPPAQAEGSESCSAASASSSQPESFEQSGTAMTGNVSADFRLATRPETNRGYSDVMSTYNENSGDHVDGNLSEKSESTPRTDCRIVQNHPNIAKLLESRCTTSSDSLANSDSVYSRAATAAAASAAAKAIGNPTTDAVESTPKAHCQGNIRQDLEESRSVPSNGDPTPVAFSSSNMMTTHGAAAPAMSAAGPTAATNNVATRCEESNSRRQSTSSDGDDQVNDSMSATGATASDNSVVAICKESDLGRQNSSSNSDDQVDGSNFGGQLPSSAMDSQQTDVPATLPEIKMENASDRSTSQNEIDGVNGATSTLGDELCRVINAELSELRNISKHITQKEMGVATHPTTKLLGDALHRVMDKHFDSSSTAETSAEDPTSEQVEIDDATKSSSNSDVDQMAHDHLAFERESSVHVSQPNDDFAHTTVQLQQSNQTCENSTTADSGDVTLSVQSSQSTKNKTNTNPEDDGNSESTGNSANTELCMSHPDHSHERSSLFKTPEDEHALDNAMHAPSASELTEKDTARVFTPSSSEGNSSNQPSRDGLEATCDSDSEDSNLCNLPPETGIEDHQKAIMSASVDFEGSITDGNTHNQQKHEDSIRTGQVQDASTVDHEEDVAVGECNKPPVAREDTSLCMPSMVEAPDQAKGMDTLVSTVSKPNNVPQISTDGESTSFSSDTQSVVEVSDHVEGMNTLASTVSEPGNVPHRSVDGEPTSLSSGIPSGVEASDDLTEKKVTSVILTPTESASWKVTRVEHMNRTKEPQAATCRELTLSKPACDLVSKVETSINPDEELSESEDLNTLQNDASPAFGSQQSSSTSGDADVLSEKQPSLVEQQTLKPVTEAEPPVADKEQVAESGQPAGNQSDLEMNILSPAEHPILELAAEAQLSESNQSVKETCTTEPPCREEKVSVRPSQ